MQRAELLTSLFIKYPKFFTSKDLFNAWSEDYTLLLPDCLDYSEVHRRMVLKYTDMYKPPSPAELHKIKVEVFGDETTRKQREKALENA